MSHKLYSHDQKTGRVKETSALSTSRTEILLNTESTQQFYIFVGLFLLPYMITARPVVTFHLMNIKSACSHQQSDPCCVFLPGLAVCTDIRSDNSTADTERNLKQTVIIRVLFGFKKKRKAGSVKGIRPYFDTESRRGTGS